MITKNVCSSTAEVRTEGLTKDTLRLDTVGVLKAVDQAATFRYINVHVTATYSLQDQLGNASEEVVAMRTIPEFRS